MRIPKIHHLIRYVIIIGIVAFVAYLKNWQSKSLLLLLGPPIYLSATAQDLLSKWFTIPATANVRYFGFLLPVTLIYFSVTGFLFKQLWNERGLTRFISVLGIVGFIAFIHYISWQNLLTYMSSS